MRRACEPCSRDDCENCRYVNCACCGDSQNQWGSNEPTQQEYDDIEDYFYPEWDEGWR